MSKISCVGLPKKIDPMDHDNIGRTKLLTASHKPPDNIPGGDNFPGGERTEIMRVNRDWFCPWLSVQTADDEGGAGPLAAESSQNFIHAGEK